MSQKIMRELCCHHNLNGSLAGNSKPAGRAKRRDALRPGNRVITEAKSTLPSPRLIAGNGRHSPP